VDRLFRCPECGKPLQPHDNLEVVEAVEWKIKQLETCLEEITKVKRVEEKT